MVNSNSSQTQKNEKIGWVSCGIPAPQSDHAAFWQKWAQSAESRKCPCGEMVLAGACPVCGREYDSANRK